MGNRKDEEIVKEVEKEVEKRFIKTRIITCQTIQYNII